MRSGDAKFATLGNELLFIRRIFYYQLAFLNAYKIGNLFKSLNVILVSF
jgi:hypothetical protein